MQWSYPRNQGGLPHLFLLCVNMGIVLCTMVMVQWSVYMPIAPAIGVQILPSSNLFFCIIGQKITQDVKRVGIYDLSVLYKIGHWYLPRQSQYLGPAKRTQVALERNRERFFSKRFTGFRKSYGSKLHLIALGTVHSDADQGDQMARLFAQYLALYKDAIFTQQNTKFAKVGSNLFQIIKNRKILNLAKGGMFCINLVSLMLMLQMTSKQNFKRTCQVHSHRRHQPCILGSAKRDKITKPCFFLKMCFGSGCCSVGRAGPYET